MSNTLPINEVFQTIQGEARFTGTPSVFIRLQGCTVGCVWCDTKHTWDLEIPEKVLMPSLMLAKTEDSPYFAQMTIPDIMAMLDEFEARHIVITGGEPCMYNLVTLTESIIASGRSCQVETSGTYPIQVSRRTWVTLSPKIDMAGKKEVLHINYKRADEIKFPVGKMADVEKLLDRVIPHITDTDIWLQPLSQNKTATALCVEQATKYNWRVSIQTHKFIGVR